MAVLIALVLKTFLVQAFVIPSGSMEQTIRIGDRVLVDKLTPWFGAKPHRGDVVVFKDPDHWLGAEETPRDSDPAVLKGVKKGLTFIGLLPSADERDLIKRVIGTGGDRVKCCDAQGRVSVNGTALRESYISPGNQPSEVRFDVKVPPGRLFVMGDHRADSGDSRFHLDSTFRGTVSQDAVVGRAVAIAWPLGHWATPGHRETFAHVTDAPGGTAAGFQGSHKVASQNPKAKAVLPTPAELPLVMGVVGLRPVWRGQRHDVRSGCGGRGGGRSVRTRRTRGAGAGRGTGRRRPRRGPGD